MIDLAALEAYVKEAMGVAAETNDGVIFRARNAGAVLALIAELRASRKVMEQARSMWEGGHWDRTVMRETLAELKALQP